MSDSNNAKSKKSFVAFGHPLLDIVTHVDTSFLARYNAPPGATMLATPEQEHLFDEIAKHGDVEYVPGGAAMNTTRVCHWLLRGQATCSFVGCLGEDNFGAILQTCLKASSIEGAFEYYSSKPTGTCACLVCGKERTLVANLGSALYISIDFVKSERVTKILDNASVVYCEGFFLNLVANPLVATYVAKYCSDRDIILAYNFSAPYLCTAFRELWAQVLPFVDIIFGNKVDFCAFAETQGWDVADVCDVAMRVALLPKANPSRGRIAVLTHGEEPTIVASAQGLTEYDTPLVPSDVIVDLNGAGDAFAGGFLGAYMLGHHLDQCVQAGQYASKEVIQRRGCSFPVEPKYELRA